MPPPQRTRSPIPIAIGGAVLGVLVVGGLLIYRADARTNKVALSAAAKPVSATTAKSGTFRPSRTYVGTLEPWVEANVGPQLVSAYVDTVLVRPGAVGEAEARCSRRSIAATPARRARPSPRRRAPSTRASKALADESARFTRLLDGGFVAAERGRAEGRAEERRGGAAQRARRRSSRASRSRSTTASCARRSTARSRRAPSIPAPSCGPGTPIVSVVDRSTVRMIADVPEIDFDVVAPGTPVRVHVLATDIETTAAIARRAPSADPATRTVHFEIDLPDPEREDPGQHDRRGPHRRRRSRVAATEVPLFAASVRGSKATLFVVDGDVAHAKTFAVKGESGGSLFVETSLAPGTRIVTEGRALLQDGDRVTATEEPASAEPPSAAAPAPRAGAHASDRRSRSATRSRS